LPPPSEQGANQGDGERHNHPILERHAKERELSASQASTQVPHESDSYEKAISARVRRHADIDLMRLDLSQGEGANNKWQIRHEAPVPPLFSKKIRRRTRNILSRRRPLNGGSEIPGSRLSAMAAPVGQLPAS
jgi:hypothetical protein